jgi:hypothetical protein
MANIRTRTLILTAIGALLCTWTTSRADALSRLSDRQLDGVTSGGIFVFSSADADALAAYRTMAMAAANTIAGTNAGVQEGFSSEGGLATGHAVGFGLNGADPTAPPATSNTTVTTGGVASGNYQLTISGGGTTSALGLTIQVGMTSVYGVWVPGL